MRSNNTFKIALGGICLALTVAFMFGGSFVPGIELTLYAISSFFIAVMIIETGLKGGIGLYAASVLLGLLIIPNKLGILPYALLFGLYGIVKYAIEKVKHPAGQIVLKILFFGTILSLALLFFKELFLGAVELPDFPFPVLLICGILFLLLYDAIYTYLINMYINRMKRGKLPREIKVSREQEQEEKREE